MRNAEPEWPYGEKAFAGKWCFGVLQWFFSGGRWLFVLFLLAAIEQAGGFK